MCYFSANLNRKFSWNWTIGSRIRSGSLQHIDHIFLWHAFLTYTSRKCFGVMQTNFWITWFSTLKGQNIEIYSAQVFRNFHSICVWIRFCYGFQTFVKYIVAGTMRSEKDISIFFLYLIWYLYNFTRFTSEKKRLLKLKKSLFLWLFFTKKKYA